MKIAITGVSGFLGWHTRLRAHARTGHDLLAVSRENWADLPALIAKADAVIHLAGVNRASTDDEVEMGNITLAQDLSRALGDSNCRQIVFANSAQAGNRTPYGNGKLAAAKLLRTTAEHMGAAFVDVRLPNIFGEHGRPQYNSFVASFIDAKIKGATPSIRDRPVPLLHAQEAAELLLAGLTSGPSEVHPPGEAHSVGEVWDLLVEFERAYAKGEIPALTTSFRVQLFNAYRAALFPQHTPIPLDSHTDHRGTFLETLRSRGGEGQSSISTTAPGVTRGQHYHLRKIERFVVLNGQATISLRKMFTNEVASFDVRGEEPCAIDMPIGWAHNITNTGSTSLITQFWSHELFDPQDPDTYPEPVATPSLGARA